VSLLATEELEVAPVLAVCDSAAAVLVAVEAALVAVGLKTGRLVLTGLDPT